MAALLALLSSAVWGAADFGGGLLSRRLPAIAVVAWSQAAGLLAITVVAVVVGAGGPGGWVVWSVVAGLSGTGGLVAFYAALASGTMGIVSPIAALGAVVPVLAGLVSGDRPSAVQLLGMVLGIGGAVTASGPELSAAAGGGPFGTARSRAVVLAALAGLLFGVALLSIQRGARSDPVLTLLGMRVVSVSLLVTVGLVLRSRGGVRARDLPALAAVGVGDVGANLLFGLASARGVASVVAVLGALYPVVTVLLGAAVLGERLRLVQRFGVLLALAGVALLAAG